MSSAGQGRFALWVCWWPQPLPCGTAAPDHLEPMSCSERGGAQRSAHEQPGAAPPPPPRPPGTQRTSMLVK
eukprot:6856496-Alexandrium_andersonii.AAC.1